MYVETNVRIYYLNSTAATVQPPNIIQPRLRRPRAETVTVARLAHLIPSPLLGDSNFLFGTPTITFRFMLMLNLIPITFIFIFIFIFLYIHVVITSV
jgi:hypothetical protein